MKKVVLITGAGSGFGIIVSERFVNAGYKVYGGARTVSEIKGDVIPLKLDITSNEDCKKAIKKIGGRLDVLVNLAGLTLTGPTLDFEVDDFKNILDTNVIGAFRLAKYALPLLKKSKGNIINITSLNGLLSLPNFGIYAASKHALEALGIALFYELKKDGVKVTNMAPGAIYNPGGKPMGHKPAREKFKILYYLMPMVTQLQVADRILEVSKSENPPASILMGNDAKLTLFAKRLIPGFLWTSLIQFVWSYDGTRKR